LKEFLLFIYKNNMGKHKDKKCNGYIYLLIDKRNNKKYIGKHKGVTSNYFTGGKIPKAIAKKYGKNIFEKIILENNIDSLEKLSEREKYYINFYDTFNNGYNLTMGGEGGGEWIYKWPKDKIKNFLKKKSEISALHKHSPETKEKLRQIHLGMKASEEAKRKMSEKRKGIKRPDTSARLYITNHKSQKISIDGIEYKTIRYAAECLNMKEDTVRARVNSKSPKFVEWFRVNPSN